MLKLHAWPTPNAHKVSIFLEETGLEYEIVPVDIGAGDQFKPDFLKISPNNKMPALEDSEGPDGQPIALFESGAILIYLADKTGRFLSSEPRARYVALQWLMFQMGGVGPMLGQAHHFRQYAPEKLPYAIERYTNEAQRLYKVVNERLEQHEFLADEYSIADMATFPWLRFSERQGVDLEPLPHLRRWLETLEARPAVQRGLAIMAEQRRPVGQFTDEERERLFGKGQLERR